MVVEKTETHEIRRGDGKIVLEVTYTPRTGRPLRLYRLKMSVKSAEDCSPNIFVYQRSATGAPMEDGSPRDEFVCVADALDEDEIPTSEQGVTANMPYYRVDSVELLFRSVDMMYESANDIIASIAEVR